MNWQKSDTISSFTDRDHLLVVYGTNKLVSSLTLEEIVVPDELTYSFRLRGEGQRETWLSARASLRLVISSFLNKAPRDIEFRKGRFGKLFLENSDLFFNVSHAKYSFLLGFSCKGRIGVDLERLNHTEDLPALVNYAFSKSESRYCLNGMDPDKFVEIWTLKEAFLKAAGVGLVDELPAVSVVNHPQNDIGRFNLRHRSFLCPNGETGSVVSRDDQPIKFIWLI